MEGWGVAGAPDRGAERWPAHPFQCMEQVLRAQGWAADCVATSRAGTVDLQLPGCPGVTQPRSSQEAVKTPVEGPAPSTSDRPSAPQPASQVLRETGQPVDLSLPSGLGSRPEPTTKGTFPKQDFRNKGEKR